MPLQPGAQLGGYEIVSPLGAGGMGEVYRARDTQLGREVAIKLLLEEVAADPDRLARFEREARVLASLNHTNVATLYGFETHEGASFLIMELVEGDTLAERIKRGPIALNDALTIFIEIAKGLEAAHEKGIIHRDLKPANIKLGGDGEPLKILDFGLAKATVPEGQPAGDASQSMSPTLTLAATQRGEVMGTAAYMSPEQAKGGEVDARTDIWAFGACLYEALRGQRAFHGGDATDVMASVLAAEPDWDALPPATPGPLRRLLRRCMEKNRRKRVPDIGYVRFELEDVRDSGDVETPDAVAAKGRRGASNTPRLAFAILLGAAAATAATLWFSNMRPRLDNRPAIRTHLSGSQAEPILVEAFLSSFDLAPDGQAVAYRTREGIHIRRVGELVSRKVAPERAFNPIFSPDSQWLAYLGSSGLEKISLRGGPPITLCECPAAFASWADDGFIYYTVGNIGTDLHRVPEDGGETESIAIGDNPLIDLRSPQLLPGGKQVLLTLHATSVGRGGSQLGILDVATGELTTLVEEGGRGTYTDNGYLVYGVDGTLMAVPFEADSRELSGAPVPILEGLSTSQLSGSANFAISGDGSLAYVSGGANQIPQTQPVWLDVQGRSTALDLEPGFWSDPRISPDGRKIAVSNGDNEADIWILDLVNGSRTRLTFETGIDNSPVWSPDGNVIYFAANRKGTWDIYRRAADGTGQESVVLETAANTFPSDVTPDGAQLIYRYGQHSGTGTGIGVLRVDGDGAATPTDFELAGRGAAISPDGRWIAHVGQGPGSPGILVRPFPNIDDGRWQISAENGRPRWGADGDEILLLARGRLKRVPVDTSNGFQTGPPEVLFETGPEGITFNRSWDLHPDGQRFIMIQRAETPSIQPEIVLVQNFLAELERLVPKG